MHYACIEASPQRSARGSTTVRYFRSVAERFAQRQIRIRTTAGQGSRGPDASPREPRLLIVGDPILVVRLTRSRDRRRARRA
jgi:hypothetical protein